MAAHDPVFALNHMCAPDLSVPALCALARDLGAAGVEIRNDIAGNAIEDGTPPGAVAAAAGKHAVRILSINALQRFNAWDATREEEARALVGYARACGAEALVLVPTNDGSGRANGERQANLWIALKGLRPMLEDAGIVGLVEPLGFATSSLRHKAEAVETVEALRAGGTFRLVHDTFHHHLAGERRFFAAHTGLVHISGVTEAGLETARMRDGHRVLVDEDDRLGNADQLSALTAAGYAGCVSFEPFSDSVHRLPDREAALARSMRLVAGRMRQPAA